MEPHAGGKGWCVSVACGAACRREGVVREMRGVREAGLIGTHVGRESRHPRPAHFPSASVRTRALSWDLGPSSPFAHSTTTFPDFLPRICIDFYATLKEKPAATHERLEELALLPRPDPCPVLALPGYVGGL